MAYNGSGTFNRTNGVNSGSTTWALDAAAGTKILAARMDTHDQDIADGLSNAICKDGQTTITANLPMATYRHTGVGNAAARTDYAAAGQVQDAAITWGGTSGGSATAQTITLTPAPSAYTTGMMVSFIAGYTNTTSNPTLNVNSLGAKTIKKLGGMAALVAGDIIVGSVYQCVYDGTDMVLLNPSLGRMLERSVTQIQTDTSTSEVEYTFTLPAGLLGATQGVRAWLWGSMYNNSGGGINYTFKTKLGTTTVYTDTYGVNSSSSFGNVKLEIEVWNKTASTQTAHSTCQINDPASGSSTNGASQTATIFHAYNSAITESTTGTVDVTISIQMDTSSANARFYKMLFAVEAF